MRAGVAAAPERADLKLQLVRALFRSGAMAEIVDRVRPAVTRADADPELLYYLGRAALATGNFRLAADALRVATAAGTAPAFGYLAEAFARLERADEALEAAGRGLEHSPLGFTSLRIVAGSLRDRGQVERLWTLCVEHRARGAWGGWFSAVMASTAASLGIEDELEALVNAPRWFSVRQLAVPTGFNGRLAAELLALHSNGGRAGAARRIDRLEVVGGPLTQDLFIRVREAVDAYVAERQALMHHPIMALRPQSVALHGWSLVAQDNSYHDWHIHRAGWISGVYYVTMPKVEPSDLARPGEIEFGLFPLGRDEEKLGSHRWHLTPEPGLVLLFPSYYAHRTRPTGVGDPRISVAFDIRPSETQAEAE
jgi:hypothetical protein